MGTLFGGASQPEGQKSDDNNGISIFSRIGNEAKPEGSGLFKSSLFSGPSLFANTSGTSLFGGASTGSGLFGGPPVTGSGLFGNTSSGSLFPKDNKQSGGGLFSGASLFTGSPLFKEDK
jgi:hypothetical protein